jgi:hypothetical protein
MTLVLVGELGLSSCYVVRVRLGKGVERSARVMTEVFLHLPCVRCTYGNRKVTVIGNKQGKGTYTAVHGRMCELHRTEDQLCLRDAKSLHSHIRNKVVIKRCQRKSEREIRTGEKNSASLKIILSVRAFNHDRNIVLDSLKHICITARAYKMAI